MPVRCRPKRMITTPATRARVDLYWTAKRPTSVESAPRVMKTMLKPMMKAIEFSMTLRSSEVSWIWSSSTPTPEISETYPGTSGSTQGERNETSPAMKAAIGVGLAILDYCTCRRTTPLSAEVTSRGQSQTPQLPFESLRGKELGDDLNLAMRAYFSCEDKVAGASATILRITSDGTMAVRTARSSFCSIWMLLITRSKSASARWPVADCSADSKIFKNVLASATSCLAESAFLVKASARKCTAPRYCTEATTVAGAGNSGELTGPEGLTLKMAQPRLGSGSCGTCR